MNSLSKIISRSVLMTALIALLLLLLNLLFTVSWLQQHPQDYPMHYRTISDSLTLQDTCYTLTPDGMTYLQEEFSWAMLLNPQGQIIWSWQLPQSLQRVYSLNDVASFSRWYLDDYPVTVWTRSDGLLVLGNAQHSYWKYLLIAPTTSMEQMPTYFRDFSLLNAVIALLLALLSGLWLYSKLKPLSVGITALSIRQPVHLPEKGITGDLNRKLNNASSMLLHQQKKLQQRDETRTHWISGVSHDIRTPLSIVMGYASQLEEDDTLSAEQHQKAVMIRQQSERIKALISNLNLASKLEYGAYPLSLMRCAPAVLIRKTAADWLNQYPDNRYPIEVSISDAAAATQIVADEQLLQRMLENLIGNSIRHNPDGCSIQIDARITDQQYQITIQDDGCGFPEKVLRNLRSSGKPRQHAEHGLGLTIVQQIVTAHGGVVHFSNVSQGGCLVGIQLPCTTNI